MLINLRNALMAGKRLPYDAELEYLGSTGTQWIDTGIVPTADDSFYCRIQQSSIRDQCLWGLAGVAYCFSNTDYAGQTTGGTYWGHPAIGTGGVMGVNPLGDTNWHEILCQPSGVLVDGVQINTQVTAPTQSPLNTVALFARSVNSVGGGVAKNSQGRISAFKVEHNGTLVRDYIPVRVGSGASAVGYLYDRVSGKLFGNAGTGDFVLGPDVVPVEWVQSATGYEYISTGVLPSADLRTKIRASYMYNPISSNSSLFGSKSASSDDRYWINYDGHVEIGYGNYFVTSLKLSTGELVDIDFNYIENGEHKVKVNDLVTTVSGNPNTTVGIILFGRISGTTLNRCTARFYYADFIRDGVDVGKFRPVRVGTEGAMMDVLTRRIYRNAGTGAFTYGNDLKYPMPAS